MTCSQRGLADDLGHKSQPHAGRAAAANAQGNVQAQRAGGHDLSPPAPPSFMMVPLPNCFSICASAAAKRLAFQNSAQRFADWL
jgi:hypothetical protein